MLWWCNVAGRRKPQSAAYACKEVPTGKALQEWERRFDFGGKRYNFHRFEFVNGKWLISTLGKGLCEISKFNKRS